MKRLAVSQSTTIAEVLASASSLEDPETLPLDWCGLLFVSELLMEHASSGSPVELAKKHPKAIESARRMMLSGIGVARLALEAFDREHAPMRDTVSRIKPSTKRRAKGAA